jgi:hypothetical protein
LAAPRQESTPLKTADKRAEGAPGVRLR